MLIEPARFKLLLPEFASVDDARLVVFIEKADPYFDVCRWGDLLEDGVLMLVAHTLSMADLRAKQAANPLGFANAMSQTGKKVGDVSVTRDAGLMAKGQDEDLYLTPYGQTFLALRRQVGLGAVAV